MLEGAVENDVRPIPPVRPHSRITLTAPPRVSQKRN
jgi:hypothetical protein